jgi:hypothetical protein
MWEKPKTIGKYLIVSEQSIGNWEKSYHHET